MSEFIIDRLTSTAHALKESRAYSASVVEEGIAEITRLRQLLSEAQKREKEARAKALEDLKSAAERVGKRDAYSNDVIKYAFQRGVVAAAKRFSSAVSALQSEER